MHSLPPGYTAGVPQNITVIASLGRILSLTNDGTINLVATMVMIWNDSRLAWNISERNYSEIFMEASNIWTPQLLILNPANHNLEYKADLRDLLLVHHTGQVQLALPRLYTASCQLDLTRFPFDSQTCGLIFSEKHYTESFLRFTTTANGQDFGICKDAYTESTEWKLMNSYLTVGTKTRLVSNERLAYSKFKVSLVVKRYPSYFVHNLIIPASIMFLLLSLLLVLPSVRSERITLCSSLVVSIYVLQQTESSIIPVNSGENIPYCAKGMLSILILSVTALVLCVMNIIIRHFEPQFPPGIREVLARVVFALPGCAAVSETIRTGKRRFAEDQQQIGGEQNASETSHSTANCNWSIQQQLEIVADCEESPNMLPHVEQSLAPFRRATVDSSQQQRLRVANQAAWAVVDYIANLLFFCGYVATAIYFFVSLKFSS